MAKDIRHAYIISCYKLPEQVVRLVGSLNNPESFFLIHVDRKSSDEYTEKIKKRLLGFGNVVLLKRHKCYWGDFGHVRATLKAINYLIAKNINFDYFHVLTGQDYPIKSHQDISKILNNKKTSYMEFFTLPNSIWANGGMDRVENIHVNIHGRRVEIPKSLSRLIHQTVLPLKISKQKDFKFYGGSGYFSLNKKHTKYIYKFINKNPDYIRFFKTAHISDEIFFQTIILNSKYNKEIINDNLRLIDWSGPTEYPSIFTISDIAEIKKSKELFARKFDITRGEAILDEIDKLIK